MASKEYVVDVSAYQPSSMARYHSSGAKQVVVKATEGMHYNSPVAFAQIKSAHAHHMYVHAYHFATFGHSVRQAKAEARHFVNRCKVLGISKKRYLFVDWETGDGNVVTGSRSSNTKAILAFMKVCHDAGYKVGLYSGASILRNNVSTSQITKKYGTCLWVASYATMGRIDTPNFGYFPSMNGVAIWQFTDNWHGLNVDGNISLIDLHKDSGTAKVQKKSTSNKPSSASKPQKEQKGAEKKATGVVYAPVINRNPSWLISLRDSNGHATGKYIRTNTQWKYFATKIIGGKKYYKLGTEKQWVPAKYLKVVK